MACVRQIIQRNCSWGLPEIKRLQRTRVTIRRAILGDEPALAELNAFVQDFHVANNPTYFKPSTHDDVVGWFRGLLEMPMARIWIAVDGDTAVGYVIALARERSEHVFGRSRRWLEIDQIGVRPGHRRRGIGRSLVEAVLQAADGDGIRDVELSTWAFNREAQRAFRRLGFTPRVVRFGWESSKP
jgi:diamine N-acetyltransferase